MDIQMTTLRPPCVPPFSVEVVRFVDSGKNIREGKILPKRLIVSSMTTDIRAGFGSNLGVDSEKENIIKYKTILESFNALEDNWDGYGTSAPSASIIDKSIQILNVLNDFEGLVNIVYPLEDGIQIDFNSSSFKYEIEVYDSNIKLVKFDSDEEYLETVEFSNASLFSLNDHLI
ncbi:hypothetical protein [Sphingobacterium kyonggiense]